MRLDVFSFDNLSDLEMAVDFDNAYREKGIKKCSMISMSNRGISNSPSLIIFRSFIELSERIKKQQKYVVCLRFYSFGEVCTVDLVSLDKSYHKDICLEHLKRMSWPLNKFSYNKYEESIKSPYIFAGGFIKLGHDNFFNFFGRSVDYGGEILFSNSNCLAAYILSLHGLDVSHSILSIEEDLVSCLLKFMLENKLKKDFYKKLISSFCEDADLELPYQHISAMSFMSAFDKHLLGEGDIYDLLRKEFSEGVGKEAMLKCLARKIKRTKDSLS